MTDLLQAHAQAQAGMAQAEAHAESIEHAWSAAAFMYVHKYARTHRTFVAADCIAAAIKWGLACPVPKAFGPVFKRAARVGVITRIDFVPSERRHCAPVPLWASNVYRESSI